MHNAFKQALDDNLIEPAIGPDGGLFEIDGKRLYLATDSGIGMLMGRFYAFSDVLRKHDTLKLTDDSLTTALVLMRDMQRRALAQLALDPEQAMDCLRESLTIIERIQERRKLGLDMAQVYDIAAIWYLTEDEDPGTYEPTIGRWKVAEWLKTPALFAFFLRTPMRRFVDLRALLEVDTLLSIQTLNQLEMIDWKRMSVKQSPLGLTSDTISTTESRLATLFAYDTLNDLLLKPTTSSSAPGSESRID